ncbi:MAG TPA: M1 family metallopeptidase [Candidatus Saccharimonadales bacterium]|nr:M1 family metallopeptidase [Candidatus Saccharimonadales bacterium]
MSKKVKRLFEGFQPGSYRIELNPDPESMRLEGTVVITGQRIGRPSQRLTFHQHGLKIIEATVTKQDKKTKSDLDVPISRISHHASFDEVRLHSDSQLFPGLYTITMRFTGKVQEGMHGIYASNYEENGQKKKIVSTQFESHHAREAFPCIDEPEAKATFELTLISPKGQPAISNMPAADQSEKDSRLVTTFEPTPRMSTYLLAFVYGDMHFKETKTKNGVDVRVWASKAQAPESLDFGLEVAKRGIEFFEEYFGVPYPLDKCDHVAIPNFSSGAMENWGLITYRERCLIADPATTSQSGREVIAMVVCHELSHQWFGNLVTMKWWDDLWLNESFANVMEYVAPAALFPEWDFWNTFITQEGLGSLRRDSIAGVQAVKTEVRHPDEISTLFDPSIVYAKGGRLLKMMFEYIGEEDLRKGLKAYFTKHAYKNTTGDDLWKALGDASGKDVAAFMVPWLTRSGFPLIEADQHGKDLTVRQRHFLLDPAKADKERIWPVPLLSGSPEIPALLETREKEVTLSSEDFVRINQGALGHYIVRYVQPAHSAAIAKLVSDHKLGVAERLMLLSDSTMLGRAGTQSFAATMELLEHYADENQEAVWDIMALVLADCRRFIDTAPEVEEPIKALIRKLIEGQYQRLGWEERPGEPSQDTKLRATIIGLGVYSEHQAILGRALELFDAYRRDATAIHSELRGIVFSAAVRHNVEGAFDYLLRLDKETSNVDLKQDILGSLTTERKEAQIAILLERLKDSEKVRQQDVDHWLVYLLRSRYARPQAWKWLRGNWEWIEKTFAGDKSYDYFPRYAASAFNTRKLLNEYKAFFEPKQEQPILRRNIIMGVEELENRISWIERDLAAIRAYFKIRP